MRYFYSGIIKLLVASVFVASLLACGGAEERKLKYLEKGKAYLEDKNYDKARIEFKNVLQIDPKYAEAYYFLGQLDEKRRELSKALGNYNKAISIDPNYNNAKIKLSRIYVVAGTENYINEAKKLLNEVVKSGLNTSEVQLILATIEYKIGDKDSAISSIEDIVLKDINLIEGVRLLSGVYRNRGEKEKEEALLIKAIAGNPNNILFRYSLASLYAETKNFQLAEKHLKEIVNIEPEQFSHRKGLGVFYAKTDQLNKAEKIFRQAIADDESDVQRYLSFVEFVLVKYGEDKAITEIDEFVKIEPDLYDLKFVQASIYRRVGDVSKAKSILNNIINNKSYDVEGVKARTTLAAYLIEEGKKEEAERYVEDVLSEYPGNIDALFLSSKLAIAKHDLVTAVNNLRTVIKNDPKNVEASLLLAKAHDLNNEEGIAQNVLKRSIEAFPENDKTHLNYAVFLVSKGRKEEALNVVNKALPYFKNSYDLLNIKLRISAAEGDEVEVVSLLDRMELADPQKADVNIARGKYYLSKKDVNNALDQFELALGKSKDKYKALKLLVETYVLAGKPSDALKRLQKNLQKDSSDANALQLMGWVYVTQKDINKAIEQLQLAIDAADEWMIPYSSLASVYISIEEYDKAKEIYNQGIDKVDSNQSLQFGLASLYEKISEYKNAMKIYQKILDANGENKLAANNYASLLLDHGRDEDYDTAMSLVGGFEKLNQPALRDTLAWAYAKKGNYSKSISILKPIVDAAPNVAIFRYHLGYALYYNGDKPAAKSHLSLAISSKQNFQGKNDAEKLLNSI